MPISHPKTGSDKLTNRAHSLQEKKIQTCLEESSGTDTARSCRSTVLIPHTTGTDY
jgi:hypothetical protein